MPRTSKAKAQQAHARKRAMERYGISLTLNDIRHFIAAIKRGEGRLIEHQSHRVSIYDVPFRVAGLSVADIWIRVVYDRSRSTIVSCLPRDDYSSET